MRMIEALPLIVFVLSWFGAAASWTVAAYSTLRVWTDQSAMLVDGYRSRTMKAALWSATFVATGVVSGYAAGLFSHIHV